MKRKRHSIIDAFHLESPFATEFRRLLQGLENARPDEEVKSLLVSSALLSEGKSTICSLLGVTAAVHKGIKTLIVDCDLRRPSLHKLFVLDRDNGMAEILSEAFSPRDAIKKTKIDKLDIITCGRQYAAPTELFDAEAIGCLIAEMKFHYDLVLVDAAPALPVSDPMLLATKVDGILLVVKAGSTQKEIVRRAVDILDPNHASILGVALNNMGNALPYHYDYRYYGYEYGQRPRRSRPPSRADSRRRRKQDDSARGSAGQPQSTGATGKHSD